MHHHVYLTPIEQEALDTIAREIGIDSPRDALKFALAAVIDSINESNRKEMQDGSSTEGNPR